MKNSKLKSVLKKGDILIILSVVAVSLFWFVADFSRDSDGKTVNIRLRGEICHSVKLSSQTEKSTFEAGNCLIEISSEGVCFLSSDCPDGLCVKRGVMTRVGDVMACVPEGVTVEIIGGGEIDGISY